MHLTSAMTGPAHDDKRQAKDEGTISSLPRGKSSWLPGTARVYAFCVGGRRPMGWRYSDVDDFFGLIADRVIDG